MKLHMAAAALTLATLAAFAPVSGGMAQDYPSRPITLIVPFSPGGTTDIIGRVVALELEEELGQPVVIENRPGSGSVVGSAVVSNAVPDGYTLVVSNSAAHGVSPAIYSSLPYDPVTSFAHVALLGRVPQYLLARSGLEIETVDDLLDAARAKPGVLNIGTAGEGSMGHLCSELFMMSGDVEMVRIPYGGTADATHGLLSGEVDVIFSNPPSARPLLESGDVKLIAVTSDEREADYPDVPTMQESGMPDFVTYSWYGISAPAGTPSEVVETLNQAIIARLEGESLRSRLADIGVSPPPLMTSAEFTEYVASGVESFATIADLAGIQMD